MQTPFVLAYLEPGSANFLLQLGVGAAAGVLILWRSIIARLRSAFHRSRDR